MIYGHVRDNFPYVMLTLPGQEESLAVECLVDTGFDGDLALPSAVVQRLDAVFAYEQEVRMAAGSVRRRPHYEISLDWNEEPCLTQVLVLEGLPLLGGALPRRFLIQIEMQDGGEVSIEPL